MKPGGFPIDEIFHFMTWSYIVFDAEQEYVIIIFSFSKNKDSIPRHGLKNQFIIAMKRQEIIKFSTNESRQNLRKGHGSIEKKISNDKILTPHESRPGSNGPCTGWKGLLKFHKIWSWRYIINNFQFISLLHTNLLQYCVFRWWICGIWTVETLRPSLTSSMLCDPYKISIRSTICLCTLLLHIPNLVMI